MGEFNLLQDIPRHIKQESASKIIDRAGVAGFIDFSRSSWFGEKYTFIARYLRTDSEEVFEI
jgi:hypothetical protein